MTRLKHFVIKSSQTTQLFITKVFCKQSSCHHHITKSFFVANLVKICIFLFSTITRSKQHSTQRVCYFIFSISDDIAQASHEGLNIWLFQFYWSLITCSSTVESEAPASSKTTVTFCGPSMLPRVEVYYPKTIHIKQYLDTSSFLVNNRQ